MIKKLLASIMWGKSIQATPYLQAGHVVIPVRTKGTIRTATLGDVPEQLLEKRSGAIDNDHEYTIWVEYWHKGELQHRSAHVILKTPSHPATGELGRIG